MCFLEILGGFEIQPLYKEEEFDEELLQEYLENFTSNFKNNQVLSQGLKSMLILEDEKRPFASSLLTALPSLGVINMMMKEKVNKTQVP